MATLEQRGRRYRIIFRFQRQRYTHTLGTSDPKEAAALKGGVEHTLLRLQQHLLHIPPGADVLSFILSGGQIEQPLSKAETAKVGESSEEVPETLEALQAAYFKAHEVGALEASTLATIQTHLRQINNSLGSDFVLSTLTLRHLQEHIARRSKMTGIRKRPLSPTTMKKEITSLRALWSWAEANEYLSGTFPSRGLLYPKTKEKPPFQTWEEIERRIARGIGEEEERELWDSLYLLVPQIRQLLEAVRKKARHPFLWPMFCTAAHTGARRSELIRVQKDDLDIESGYLTLHERKKSKGKHTHRRVPLTPFLVEVLEDWLGKHPGGQPLFCLPARVARSKKKDRPETGLTKDEAHNHFRSVLSDTKWEVLRGWHIFRHSFISNCVAAGVDQRMIDEWVGHQTEEMRKRYRHLLPHVERQAVKLVFDG